ncbi:MAG: DUF302 domain-containing protein [Bacteroidales bacterium]
MKFYITTTLNTDFTNAVNRATEALKDEEFGILSQIPIHEKFREKLDVNFRNYMILGACNPPLSYEALKVEDKIGTMLPCNVIIQELSKNKTEVAAVDPVVSMQGTENKDLLTIAERVKARLSNAIAKLESGQF